MNDVSTPPATDSLSAMHDAPDQSEVKRLRSWLLHVFTVVLAGALALVLVVPVILHEAIQVFVTVITGVSPSALDVGFVGVYPGVVVNDAMSNWQLTLFHYSGGLVAGAAMVYAYVRWYWGWSADHHQSGRYYRRILGPPIHARLARRPVGDNARRVRESWSNRGAAATW